MNPIILPTKTVITAIQAPQSPDASVGQGVCACGCGGPLKRKGQKYATDRCRLRAFRKKEAARIADEVRAEVYKILMEKIG